MASARISRSESVLNSWTQRISVHSQTRPQTNLTRVGSRFRARFECWCMVGDEIRVFPDHATNRRGIRVTEWGLTANLDDVGRRVTEAFSGLRDPLLTTEVRRQT